MTAILDGQRMHESHETETAPRAAEVPALLTGARIAGRYVVESVLGKGGSAVVYACSDLELGERVAVKVLRPDRGTDRSLARLRREVLLARTAESPRLARVFDIGSSGDSTFLTMELIEGGSLRDRLASGRLGIPEAVRIARQVLEGLVALHGMGVVHRDVKPGNILLTKQGEVKLADFGLARRWAADSETKEVVGTLEYFSPEQALARKLDGRSDLYSLGVVLFEMVTGERPFPRESSIASLLASLHRQAPDLRSLRPETPEHLADLVRRLLERERDDRPASARAALEDLDRRRVVGRPRARLVAAAALASAAALAGGWQLYADSRFATLQQEDEHRHVRALDARGRVLWRRGDLDVGFSAVPVRLARRGPVQIAAIIGGGAGFDPVKNHELRFLDAQTGQQASSVRLASGAGRFRGFQDRFNVARVLAVDLDGDGAEEVVVSYGHNPSYPSYTVLYDPRRDLSWVVFVGSGHHYVVGAVDLDGDGVKELILTGVNNRMGWHGAVGAVRVARPTAIGPTSAMQLAAASPDEPRVRPEGQHRVWYALGPLFHQGLRDGFLVDPGRRRLIVGSGTRRWTLGFDGFAAGSSCTLGSRERAAARERAYSLLQDANRLLLGGYPTESFGRCALARSAAEQAIDTQLVRWTDRMKASVLVRLGRWQEADEIFERLVDGVVEALEIPFEAGRELHAVGQPARAVTWFRRALEAPEVGRNTEEPAEGLLLALAELGRWDEAVDELRRYSASRPDKIRRVQQWLSFIAWRRGEPVPTEDASEEDQQDLHRYWTLELRWSRGHEEAAPLLDAVEKELARPSDLLDLLRSLRAELLARLGRREEAVSEARRALADAKSAPADDVVRRVHLPVLVRRLEGLEALQRPYAVSKARTRARGAGR